MPDRKEVEQPTLDICKEELQRVRYKKQFLCALKSTIASLVVVAAGAFLIATLWLPVLEVYGTSMSPTLEEGSLVASFRTTDFEPGDVIAFYHNSQILIKRVIAGPGDWIDIQKDGTVLIDGEPLDEPYLSEKAYGETNIELPYLVPEERWFVMGDQRSVSVDSRSQSIGPVAKEDIIGKLAYTFWPLTSIGKVN